MRDEQTLKDVCGEAKFYHVKCKAIETSTFNVNGNSLPGPIIIRTLKKRAPGPKLGTRIYEII